MKRTVTVEASCSFEFVIDDEAESDWDGAKVLDVLEKRRDAVPALYTPEATMDNLLGFLGIEVSVENRRPTNVDGWADFPDGAIEGRPYSPHWTIESVDVGEPR